MRQLTATQLKAWLDDPSRSSPVLLDVREPWELEGCGLPGTKAIPMAAVPARHMELGREDELVIVCHHGARSFQVAMFLERQGYANVYNLFGGLAAWARDVDASMPTY